MLRQGNHFNLQGKLDQASVSLVFRYEQPVVSDPVIQWTACGRGSYTYAVAQRQLQNVHTPVMLCTKLMTGTRACKIAS